MNIVIVDDETPARVKLRRFVQELSDWDIVAEAADVEPAVKAIKHHQPDLVLLDIELITGTGFDVLTRVQSETALTPKVVFITAYDEYAVKGFEVNAVDYLLKPLDRSRFTDMVKRVETSAGSGEILHRLDSLLQQIQPRPRYLQRLVLSHNERGKIVKIRDVVCIRSDGNYLNITTAQGQQQRLRSTLQSLLTQLDPEQFVRVNRSTVVNINEVAEIQLWFKGDRMLIMADGEKIKASRKYLEAARLL